MPRFIKDDVIPRVDAEDGADAVAERVLLEMRDAVGSLRTRLPEAYPRRQHRDASYPAPGGWR
jgi:hypothetical protein